MQPANKQCLLQCCCHGQLVDKQHTAAHISADLTCNTRHLLLSSPCRTLWMTPLEGKQQWVATMGQPVYYSVSHCESVECPFTSLSSMVITP